jgi:hypothetical protein
MTNQQEYLLAPGEILDGFTYPKGFVRLVHQGVVNLTPWHLMDVMRVRKEFQALAARYSSRHLFPIAYRQDNDDLACWSKGHGDTVFIIHNFASEGFEDEGIFPTFWDWFRDAVEETIQWD